MPKLSTGSAELDALLEEVRAGDNVVFFARTHAHYAPFVSAMLAHLAATPLDLVYVRADGQFDTAVTAVARRRVVQMAAVPASVGPLEALQDAIEAIGPHAYTLFDSLDAFAPWFPDEGQVRGFFTTICPLLFDLRSVAYWNLVAGRYASATIAAIKDCTQVFIKVEALGSDLLITPQKVWGRYAETMFRPHRVTSDDGQLRIAPLPLEGAHQQEYVLSLADKNRELAEIRDALQQRNQQLGELNERLAEQGRLYQSLRLNLDHLLALFQAGQAIGASLAVDQVRRAIVAGAVRLFEAAACRLYLPLDQSGEPCDYAEGLTPAKRAWADSAEGLALRAAVCEGRQARAIALHDGAQASGSMALAPIVVRGACLGTLELYADDGRLLTDEALTLLSYLASEASIALDNAHLYREVEAQGQQLRSFVENVITTEEQDSRRLAFDLHDTLVQIIVASYQHLQTAQAWRGRDPAAEGRELEQGIQLLQRAIYEARRLIAQLRPAGLDDFGLVHALRLYVAQLMAEADWQVDLMVDPRWTSLAPALEAALFRIVQEATHNAQKYAQAARVQVRLERDDEHLSVTIRDWGKGFDPAAVASEPQQGLHMGLVGIRERARLWGGQCSIESRPGRGTSIRVRIPLGRVTGLPPTRE
jgi:signal transduction histidine kinase